jgi:hypothetical protein
LAIVVIARLGFSACGGRCLAAAPGEEVSTRGGACVHIEAATAVVIFARLGFAAGIIRSLAFTAVEEVLAGRLAGIEVV